MKLNLETKTKEQQRIKAYLEENASDILAGSITCLPNARSFWKNSLKRRNLRPAKNATTFLYARGAAETNFATAKVGRARLKTKTSQGF